MAGAPLIALYYALIVPIFDFFMVLSFRESITIPEIKNILKSIIKNITMPDVELSILFSVVSARLGVES
jgi:membrane-anchored glycerophosphoryl diester phosphodiesterase (GDPDase)